MGRKYNLQSSCRVPVKAKDGADGKDGQGSLTSFVFAVADSQPATPTGGSYASPVPSGWSDGIPANPGDKAVWMSRRIFTSDGLAPQESEWTEPVIMASNPQMQIRYSAAATKPSDPSANAGAWGETADENTVWMAVRQRLNSNKALVWSAWEISRIKGENGTSVGIKATSVTYAVTKSISQPADSSFTHTSIPSTLSQGDYLWTKTAVTYTDGKSTKTYSISRIGADGRNGMTPVYNDGEWEMQRDPDNDLMEATKMNLKDIQEKTATAKLTADEAAKTAGEAKDTAEGAASTSTTAKNIADEAKKTADSKTTLDAVKDLDLADFKNTKSEFTTNSTLQSSVKTLQTNIDGVKDSIPQSIEELKGTENLITTDSLKEELTKHNVVAYGGSCAHIVGKEEYCVNIGGGSSSLTEEDVMKAHTVRFPHDEEFIQGPKDPNTYFISEVGKDKYGHVTSLSRTGIDFTRYVTLDTEQTITATKTFGSAVRIKMNVDTSNERGLVWRNAANTSNIASITCHNTAQRVIINPLGSSDTYSDTAGKYSLVIGKDELTYNTYPVITSKDVTSLFRRFAATAVDLNFKDSNNNGVYYLNGDQFTTTNNPFRYGSVLNISHTASSWQLGASEGSELWFRQQWWKNEWSKWKKVVLADKDGNVGIGTDPTAEYMLDVNGNVYFRGDVVISYNNSSTTLNSQLDKLKDLISDRVDFDYVADNFIEKDANGNGWVYGGANRDSYIAVEGSEHTLYLMVGQNNVSRGLYDGAANGWWIYRGSSSNTVINGSGLLVANLNIGKNGNQPYLYSTGGPVYVQNTSSYIDADSEMWGFQYHSSSDIRLKSVTADIAPPVEAIAGARAVDFNWLKSGREDCGCIAQDFQEIIPRCVRADEQGYLTLDYGKAALISTISVARETVGHEGRISALEAENRELKEKIKKLEDLITNHLKQTNQETKG